MKAYFTEQGYDVKGEVGAADLVAVLKSKQDDEPVIVELKTGFTLSLFHQAINRQSMTDKVYIAVPHKSGKAAFTALRKNKMLCRRLRIGLITVRLSDSRVVVHCQPAPFTPRKIKARKTRLLSEFESRHGDPNEGGMTSTGMMTSYRQGALRCAKVLYDEGTCKRLMLRRWQDLKKRETLWRPIITGGLKKSTAVFTALAPQEQKLWKITLRPLPL